MAKIKIWRRFLFFTLLICEVLSFFYFRPPQTQLDYLVYISGFMLFSTLVFDSAGLFICFHTLLIYTFLNTFDGIYLFQFLWIYFLAFICIFFTKRSKISFLSALFIHFLLFLLFNLSLFVAYKRCHNEDLIAHMEGGKAIILFLFSCPLALAITNLAEEMFTRIHDKETMEDHLVDAISLPFQMMGLAKRRTLPPGWKYWGVCLCLCFIFFGAFYYFYNPSHLISPTFCGY